MSDEKLASAINEIMTQAYKPNEPGASVIVTRNDKVVFRKGYGMANLNWCLGFLWFAFAGNLLHFSSNY